MKPFKLQLLTVIAALGLSGTASAAELLNLITSAQGMHRISYAELVQQGADLAGLRHNRFGVTLNGVPVQLRTKGQSDGDRRFFGAGGYIQFYAEKADSLYSENQVFTLHILSNRERGLRKVIRASRTNQVDRTASFAVDYMHTQIVEQNNTYDFSAPSSTDPFHFGQTFSFFATPSYTFSLDNVVGTTANANIDVEMYGLLDFDIDGNDHHFEALVNGQLEGDKQFDGNSATTLSLQDVAVNSGENTFKYNYRSIEGVPFDRISLNKLTVSYRRTTEANGEYLEGFFSGGQARVSNVGSGRASVYRKRADGTIERIVKGLGLLGTDTIFNTGGVAADYVVIGQGGYKPLIVQAIEDQQDISSGTAEYLVIAHPSLMGDELDELVRVRSQQYLVKVVDVNQIYAQFGNHIVSDKAIRAYIKHAAANMSMKMTVLVGSDTLDPKQYVSESLSLIPTSYVSTPGGALTITQTPSDASYGDLDLNRIPDVPVARISARNVEELGHVVAKIKAYEAREGYVGRTVIATDKEDLGNGISFADDAEAIIAAIPAQWSDGIRADFKAYPDVDGQQQAHDKLINLINAGVSVVSYIGHSSQQSWAYTTPPMLRANELSGLTNFGKPAVVTQWGCWNTYFVDPSGNTMADVFLLNGENGAASVLGASTLTSSSGERALGIELNKRLYLEGMTLGEAVILAKQALAQYEDFPAIQLGYQILGDPGLVINH